MPDRLFRSPSEAPAGIVHLGLGAFFRAHGAIYLAEAMAAGGGDWGVTGVSLQSPGTRDRLRYACRRRLGGYHAIVRDPSTRRFPQPAVVSEEIGSTTS